MSLASSCAWTSTVVIFETVAKMGAAGKTTCYRNIEDRGIALS